MPRRTARGHEPTRGGSGLRTRAARRLTLEYTLAGVVGALAAADIRSLVLKGPAFAHWLYDDPSERSYQDFDLLVAPADVAAARAVLAARGFEPLPEGTHEHERTHHESWQRAETPAVTVELHHTLPLVGATPELLWERFSAGRRTLAIAGGSVETPGLAASALLVALHAAWHRDDSAKPRVDLARALDRLDEPAWRAAAALARELDAEPGFVAGLAKVPGGRTLIDDLGLGLPGSRAPCDCSRVGHRRRPRLASSSC